MIKTCDLELQSGGGGQVIARIHDQRRTPHHIRPGIPSPHLTRVPCTILAVTGAHGSMVEHMQEHAQLRNLQEQLPEWH